MTELTRTDFFVYFETTVMVSIEANVSVDYPIMCLSGGKQNLWNI